MDRLVIHGGRPLAGCVAISGSKNAALPIMAASVLLDGPCRLSRVPELGDVATMSALLESLGVRVENTAADELLLHSQDQSRCRAPYRLVRRMRAGICLLGPLVARRGRGVMPLPGGCRLGDRPIDLHLAGLAALGADIRFEHGAVIASAKRLRGAHVHLRGPRGTTVTGTANLLCAATLAHGATLLTGAAVEPEIVDLGSFLIAAGAKIQGLGTPRIEIQGVESLGPATWSLIPDRIEAATLLLSGCITRGVVSVRDCVPDHFAAVIDALREMGAVVSTCGDQVILDGRHARIPGEFVASAFPGLPTDIQPQLAACLALAEGASAVRDTVFPERAGHVAELNRLGASLQRSGDRVEIRGVRQFSAAPVLAPDLRAGAALVLAGLAARGRTVIGGLRHIDRGYDRLDAKLQALGADITRQPGTALRSISYAKWA